MSTQTIDIPFLDILAPDFTMDSPEVAEARTQSSCANTAFGSLVIRYDAVQQVLEDPRIVKDNRRYLLLRGISDGPLVDWWTRNITNLKGEKHKRMRNLLFTALKPQKVENLRPFVRATAEQLSARLAGADSIEVMAGYTDELVERAFRKLVGIPEDFEPFAPLTNEIALVQNLLVPDVQTRGEQALSALIGYLDRLIELRSADPGEDLMSILLAAQRNADGLTTEEIRNLVLVVLIAGFDASRQTLGLCFQAFCEHPDQWSVLAERPDLMPSATEEVLRFYPAPTVQYRWAATDIDIDGVVIPKGSFVMPSVHAAHRDPRAYDHPDRFDISAVREKPLLSFGAGPHSCLGTAMLRLQLQETLSVLPRRLGAPAVAAPGISRPPIGLRGPETLNLCFGD